MRPLRTESGSFVTSATFHGNFGGSSTSAARGLRFNGKPLQYR
jgi:hypothetical protein